MIYKSEQWLRLKVTGDDSTTENGTASHFEWVRIRQWSIFGWVFFTTEHAEN